MPFTLRMRELLPRVDEVLNYTIDQLRQLRVPPHDTIRDGRYNPWAVENIDMDYGALQQTKDLVQEVLDLFEEVVEDRPLPHPQLRRFQEPFPPEAIWKALPEPWEPVRPAMTDEILPEFAKDLARGRSEPIQGGEDGGKASGGVEKEPGVKTPGAGAEKKSRNPE